MVSLGNKAGKGNAVNVKAVKMDDCGDETIEVRFCTNRGIADVRKTAAVMCRSVMDSLFVTGDVVELRKLRRTKKTGYDFICDGMENNIDQCEAKKVTCIKEVLVECTSSLSGLCKSDCGCMAPTLVAKIIGGEDALPGEFPWQVTVVSEGLLCGGAIIDEYHVLSAAHCFHSPYFEDIPCAAKPGKSLKECKWVSDTHISYDSIYFIQNEDPNRKQAEVSYVFIHRDYVRANHALIHDLAVLRLKEPLQLNEYVYPVCLPDYWNNFVLQPKQLVTVTGFGDTTSYNNIAPDKLQKVSLQWEKLERCNYVMAGNLGDDHLCAGDPEGEKDACRGDSGGPLVVKDKRGVATVVGVVSFSYGCAVKGLWSVYSDVQKQIGFVRSVMEFTPDPNDVVLSCRMTRTSTTCSRL